MAAESGKSGKPRERERERKRRKGWEGETSPLLGLSSFATLLASVLLAVLVSSLFFLVSVDAAPN